MEKLDDKIMHLYRVDGFSRRLLREHFLKYSRDCAGCKECEYKHHIVELYELMCVNPQHKHNLRKSPLYEKAEQFVTYHYIKDDK